MQHKPFAQSTMGKRFLETDAPCLKTKVLFLTKKQKTKTKKNWVQLEFLKIESYSKCPGEAQITGNPVMNVFISEELF